MFLFIFLNFDQFYAKIFYFFSSFPTNPQTHDVWRHPRLRVRVPGGPRPVALSAVDSSAGLHGAHVGAGEGVDHRVWRTAHEAGAGLYYRGVEQQRFDKGLYIFCLFRNSYFV